METEQEFLRKDLKRKLTEFIKQCRVKDLGEPVYQYVTQKASTLLVTLNQPNLDSNLMRILISEVAGLTTATEWQSPSFRHSQDPQAGVLTGKITGNITDYTRDQLIRGNSYQKQFAKEFIGSWRGMPIQVLLTQSGMAALTTIITFLRRKHQFTRPVILGRNSYFQNKELIYSATHQPIIEVDEHDTKNICQKIKTENPSVIFIDSLCNALPLSVPDLQTIANYLIKTQKQETYLVIDNTGLATGLGPLSLISPLRGKIKLLVFESLNKYYQYGTDRTIGGFCWGLPQDASKLFYSRLHAGTIMSDVATAMLPTPNKQQLNKRLAILQRNALALANALMPYGAIYPGLSNHPAYAYLRQRTFSGSNVTLKLNNQRVRHYKSLVAQIFKLARQRKIPLIQGTSFGLSTTRIYITAMHTDFAEPFIRISVGTETETEMKAICRLFIDVLR